MIDLVMIDVREKEKIRGLMIEKKIESNHLPVVAEVEAAGKRRDDPKKIRGRCKEEVAGTSGIKKFQEEFGEGEVAGSEVEDAWGELKRRIKGAMKE